MSQHRGRGNRGRGRSVSKPPQHEGGFPELRRPGSQESSQQQQPRAWGGNPPPSGVWSRQQGGQQQQQQQYQQGGHQQYQQRGQQQYRQQGEQLQQYSQQQQYRQQGEQQQYSQQQQYRQHGGQEHKQQQQYAQGAISRHQGSKPKGVSGSKSTEVIREDMAKLSIGPSSIGRGSSRGTHGKPQDEQVEFIVTRPKDLNTKKGEAGHVTRFKANYFVLETHTDWCLYHYHVDIYPVEDRTVVRKKLLRVHKDKIGGYIFDGTALFTSARLAPDTLELFSNREEDDTKMRINLKLVADLAMGDHHYIQLFNILMRQSMGLLNLNLIGRNFFDALEKTTVPEYNMEIWPGYVTSIRQHESQILMCAEITHKVLRTDTVLDLYRKTRDMHNGDTVFLKLITGQIVLTNYNQRTYRVDDVNFTTTPNSIFNLKSGESISYRDYILKKYQIKVTDNNQPMLVSRPKAREIRAGMSELVYLIPELCHMTGLTDEMRGNFGLMRKLAETTRVSPDVRVGKLLQFNKRLRNSKSLVEQFAQWNLRISEKPVEFSGRVYDKENILVNREPLKLDPKSAGGDWSREMRGKPMLVCATLSNWAVIYPKQCRNALDNFISLIMKTSEPMKFRIAPPILYDVQDDKASNLVNAIERVISTKNPQLIFTVVTNNRGDRYSAIKKKCCVDRAVASQVVCSKTMQSKSALSIATKVGIQMNCKLGGSPWCVDIPLSGTMIFGFDVCHDSSNRARSYGALVGSLDKSLTRYFSAVSSHTTGAELSNDLVSNVIKALHKYKEFNQNCLPSRIIIYRDGVGDGNIPYVMNHEIEILKDNLNKIYTTPVKMAFIIVSKRINTRIFTMRDQNPAPGTVVDDVITLPHRYDFFLVSQSVRQGTVSPTSYNVIYDTLGLNADKIQRLTYKLTHLYFNWSGTVRVPAPVQYAHKLAFLVGQALHVNPNENLNDVLYFL